jgi:MFS family permease
LLSTGLAVRVVFAGAILTPLGLCLGMFMPLGLGRIASLTEHGEEYVAWGWAVNGFFSVIGSVLTTILSMALGFRAVQYAALGAYAIAVVAFTRLPAATRHSNVALEDEPSLQTVTA